MRSFRVLGGGDGVSDYCKYSCDLVCKRLREEKEQTGDHERNLMDRHLLSTVQLYRNYGNTSLHPTGKFFVFLFL